MFSPTKIISKVRSCISHFSWHIARKVAGGQYLFTLIKFYNLQCLFVSNTYVISMSYSINVVPANKDCNIIISIWWYYYIILLWYYYNIILLWCYYNIISILLEHIFLWRKLYLNLSPFPPSNCIKEVFQLLNPMWFN